MREKRVICAVILLVLAAMLAVGISHAETVQSRGQEAVVYILDNSSN